MPAPNTVVLVPDPLWFLKSLLIAIALAMVLSIGGRIVKAKRVNVAITFPIAFVTVLAGHYISRVLPNTIGLTLTISAMLVILALCAWHFLSIRVLPAIALAFVSLIAVVIGGVIINLY